MTAVRGGRVVSGDYRACWDGYAATRRRSEGYWPGDEWGAPDSWQRLFANLFLPFGVGDWKTCVEIGAGSGKYTVKVLEASTADVLAADISPAYQQHFNERITELGLAGRVTPILIESDSSCLRRAISAKGWPGALDAFYSIDAMVHVDLQHLMAYLITAAACLRLGGKLIMTLANCCSDAGFDKLIRDTNGEFQRMGVASSKFEWMAPDQVRSILPKLGFEIDLLRTQGRDIWLVASLRRPLLDRHLLQAVS